MVTVLLVAWGIFSAVSTVAGYWYVHRRVNRLELVMISMWRLILSSSTAHVIVQAATAPKDQPS